MSVTVFDERQCNLGEGPIWHPERAQFFWFDIHGKALLSQKDGEELTWQFDENVSAAGWVDHDTFLIASETQLFTFDLETEEQTFVCALEADNEITRSNDGRADPTGGFWIGTMGKHADPEAGAIYRYYDGELRKLVDKVTVSNSICFAPDASRAYYADTIRAKIMWIPLDPNTGWPSGKAQLFLDLSPEGVNPDGAVTDVDGNLWVAEWGSSRVSVYDARGARIQVIDAPALQTSCPAFGGADFSDLYVTSARVGLASKATEADGRTFLAKGVAKGRAEPRVIL